MYKTITIAGISGRGHRDLVKEMACALQHRTRDPLEIVEDGICTLALSSNHGDISEQDLSTRVYVSDGKLILRRDPLGISPLYYGFDAQGNLCFASEVKALLKATRDVHEVEPGTFFDGKTSTKYYRLELRPPRTEPAAVLTAELRQKLTEAVEKYASGDVMGSWLSGGLDSSAVVALARPRVKQLHTFAAGLAGAPDLPAARMVADFVKSTHHEIVVTPQDLLKALPDVIYHLESFDALLVRSSLTNFLAGKAAADYVSEVFSGEGGDELFGGYAYLKSLPDTELAEELIDITKRLHNTALQRVDRCASAHGLTPCVCFLDPDLVELALAIPTQYKLKGSVEKWILRQAIDGSLPQEIVSRPKAKFWEGAGVGDVIAGHAERSITDAEFASQRKLANGWVLHSKEELLYYRVFRDHFGELENLDWMGRTKGADSDS